MKTAERSGDDRLALRAGAARTAIAYPDNFFPHTSFRGRYFTGVHADLCARALFVGNADNLILIISVELGDVSDVWLPEIGRFAGIPEKNILLCATHTHSAPHAGGTWPEDVIDAEQGEAFSKLCLDAVLRAVGEAKAAMEPAQIRTGDGRCDINVNRDYRYTGTDGEITAPYIQAQNHGGISDKTVEVITFESLRGKTLAYLFNYAVHSSVAFYQSWDRQDGMLVHGDLAGTAMRYLEERGDDGAVALFTMAASADQMPEYVANHRVFDRDGNASWHYYGGDAALALVDAQGTALGRQVLRISETLSPPNPRGVISCARETITAMGKREGVPNRSAAGDNTYAGQYKEVMDERFSYVPTAPIRMPLSMICINGITLVGVPAEIVTSIGADIIGITPHRTIVITQCNGSYSYISDEEGYAERTFEAVSSHFMPGIGGQILEGVRALGKKINTQKGENFDENGNY